MRALFRPDNLDFKFIEEVEDRLNDLHLEISKIKDTIDRERKDVWKMLNDLIYKVG